MAGERVKPWTVRQWIAHWIHQLGYWFDPPEEHVLIVRDADGVEFFSVCFAGGFCAAHPPLPYTLHCDHEDEVLDL